MPNSRKPRTKKSEVKLKPEDSRLYHLPYELQRQIAKKSDKYDFFMRKLQSRAHFIFSGGSQDDNDIIDFDFNLILSKLKPNFFDDIINHEKIDDKRNFKDFQKKLDNFVDKYLLPTRIYITAFEENFEIFLEQEDDYTGNPIRELYKEDLKDYKFDPNIPNVDDEFANMMYQINDMGKKGTKIINGINKQLLILNKHFNSTLKKDKYNNFNKIIKQYNKLYGKSLPLIDEYNHSRIQRRHFSRKRRFTRSANINSKNLSKSSTQRRKSY